MQGKPPVCFRSRSFPEFFLYLSVSLQTELTCYLKGGHQSHSGVQLSSKVHQGACAPLSPCPPPTSLRPPTELHHPELPLRKGHTPIPTPAWPLPLCLEFLFPEGFVHLYGGQETIAVEDKGTIGFLSGCCPSKASSARSEVQVGWSLQPSVSAHFPCREGWAWTAVMRGPCREWVVGQHHP